MPLTSASPARSNVATVFDFLSALARRHLAQRIGCRSALQVHESTGGVFTLAIQARACGGDNPENRFAQLRSAGGDAYQLFWKNGSGRWTQYAECDGDHAQAFSGSIDECLSEIARDPRGCFWS
jgi:hypothetical protein